ncbi:MAG: helix-turn-helix transcriptional regulator [Kofleriaceae bacterium]|jgi:DNA-binding CsgD family transcriptional regulator|nr:helix-turn-helix transcriptional regulator [Kofleriaceae bacterium]MBP9166140.1 helix-turn-helix transcriptional regulator [Kofleriaceae bacterium]MBP9856970.1 helix-turn-helix transcriptional regulator [Kofleriaceae bacterium]
MRKSTTTDLRAWYVAHADGDLAVISAQAPHPGARAHLTEAERAIVRRIAAGDSNRAIADARGTSARTVANQVAAIFAKLGVASRSELLARLRGE